MKIRITAIRPAVLLLALVMALSMLSGCGNSRMDTGNSVPAYSALPDSAPPAGAGPADNKAFAAFTNELFVNTIGSNGLNLNYTLLEPDAYGISRRIRDPLGSCTPETWREDQRAVEEELDWLRGFERESLSPAQQLTWDALEYFLERQKEYAGMELHGELLGSVTGLHITLPIMLAEFRFGCEEDIELYFSLLEDLPRYFDEIAVFEEYRAKAGYFMGDEQLDELLRFCREDAPQAVGGLLRDSLSDRLEQLDWLSVPDAARYRERGDEQLEQAVLPAYAALADRLEPLRGSGPEKPGLAALPRGKEYAEVLLRDMVGIGSSLEWADLCIETRMRGLLTLVQALAEENPALEEEWRAWQGPDMSPEEILADLRDKCAAEFPLPQQAEWVVKEVSPALQEYLSPAFYLVPPIDSPEQNVIYINPAQIGQGGVLYTTLAHEGYPGHLCQSVYAAEAGLDPVRSLLGCRGYSEGWASYVEFQYAYGWALPDNELLARFASALDELSLMMMARVDFDLHIGGRNVQQIGAELAQYGFDPEAADELILMVADEPLDYLCYAMGELEFLRLREKAQTALGSLYEPIEFHRLMLEGGELPFPLLEDRLNAWISDQLTA